MENIGLINVNVHRVVSFEGILCNIVLNGGYIVVYEKLFAVFIAGKASDAVVYCDDIGIKAADKVVQRFQRGYLSAGGNVYVHAERGYFVVGVKFRVGVYRKMAFIQMSRNALLLRRNYPHIAGLVYILGVQVIFRDQQRSGGALRLVILLGNIQNVRPDHFRNVAEYLGQTVRVVLLVDILYIVSLLSLAFGVADIVDIKAESFRQIIKPVKLELVVQPYPHVPSLSEIRAGSAGRKSLCPPVL